MDFSKIKIENNPKNGAFTQDALFLSLFINLKNTENVLELGTGTGIISLLLAAHYTDITVTAVEIMQDMYNAAKENIFRNGLSSRITLINNDFRKLSITADTIVMNPPFVKRGHGRPYVSDVRASARSEKYCTMEDVFSYAHRHLSHHGSLYLIYPIDRHIELLNLSCKYSIIGKRLRYVHQNNGSLASRVLFEGKKNVAGSLNIEPPLFIHNSNGSYNEELRSAYLGA